MIEVRGLTKRYSGRAVVDGLSFTVQPGMVTGFLGPNGAGKSTTMRMILGLTAPASGIARSRVDDMIGVVGLHDLARRAGRYSLGMTQRLGIAAALLGDPRPPTT